MYNNTKIPFYKERNFGDKFSATFDFLQQNLRYVWKYLLYAIFPLGVIMGVGMNWLYADFITNTDIYDNDESALVSMGISVAVISIITLIGMIVILSLVYAIIQVYNERDNGLQDVTFDEIKPYMKYDFWRIVKFTLSSLVFLLMVGIVIALLVLIMRAFSLIVIIPGFFILAVVVQLVLPVYIYEDVTLLQAWQRGIRLGWQTFGGVLAIALVFAIITNIASSIFSIPWSVCFVIKGIAVTENAADSVAVSPWFNTLTYILAVIMGIGTFAVSMITYIAMSYQYSNAAEQEDAFSVENDIDDFDNL